MRRPLILFVILAALAPTSAMASAWYRCQADGEVRRACCCPDSDEEQPAPDAPAGIERPCCCDIDRIDAQTSDLRARSDAASIALALALTVPFELVAAMPANPEVTEIGAMPTPAESRGPPSLFLRHCSLLL